MIKIHKITGQRLLLKKGGSQVSTLYVLDNNDNKVLDTNAWGKHWLDVHGNKVYKIVICRNYNLRQSI